MSRARIIESIVEGEGYYAWHQHRVAVAGQEYWVSTRAALGPPDVLDPSAGLLAEYLSLEPDDEVLDLRCGSGLVGAAAARIVPAPQVRLYDSNSVAVEAARRSLRLNGLEGVRVEAGDPLQAQAGAEAAILRIPRSKMQVHGLIWKAYGALRPGGRLYLAGGKKEGIKSYLRRLSPLFAGSNVLVYQQGHRVGLARKDADAVDPDATPPSGWIDPRLDETGGFEFSVRVREHPIQVRSQPGLFSWDRLDPGSQMLLEAVQIDPADRVLDLGCGTGVLGAVCAQLAHQGSVVLSDVDYGAAGCARQTLALNDLKNAEVVVGDCGERLPARGFEVVVTNPPFHRGRAVLLETAFQFIRDAHRVLAEKGRLYLVANRFLPYGPVLAEHFGAVDTLAADGRYQVWLAVK